MTGGPSGDNSPVQISGASCANSSLLSAFPRATEVLRSLEASGSEGYGEAVRDLAAILATKTDESEFVAARLLDFLGREGDYPGLSEKSNVTLTIAVGYHKAAWLLDLLRDPERTQSDDLHPHRLEFAETILGKLPMDGRVEESINDLTRQLNSADKAVVESACLSISGHFKKAIVEGKPEQAKEIIDRLVPELVSAYVRAEADEIAGLKFLQNSIECALNSLSDKMPEALCVALIKTGVAASSEEGREEERKAVINLLNRINVKGNLTESMVRSSLGDPAMTSFLVSALGQGGSLAVPSFVRLAVDGEGQFRGYCREVIPEFGPEAVDALLPEIDLGKNEPAKVIDALNTLSFLIASVEFPVSFEADEEGLAASSRHEALKSRLCELDVRESVFEVMCEAGNEVSDVAEPLKERLEDLSKASALK